MTSFTPPSLYRQQKDRNKKFQGGTVLSYSVVHTQPHPLTIGLIQLDDGTKVIGQIAASSPPHIGQHLHPCMRLMEISPNGLRRYDVVYEGGTNQDATTKNKPFPGYILALTGPSGVGKSTISRLLVTMFKDIAPVPILTTRKRKESDNDNEYVYVSKNKFADLQKKREIVAFAHLADTDDTRWYGYRAQDIEQIWAKGMLPVVITERHLLQGLADHFGRRSILSLGLLPPGQSKRAMLSTLLHRLRERGRDSEESIQDRIKHAAKDLTFFEDRKDLFDQLIITSNLNDIVVSVRGLLPHLA
ncbi:OB-fold domain-containing protein [Candidatus Peregrinibacteria bacterium]|nr:OB-fold domain-containing protein [Candidatus Peregrinibacteria bacterium]